MRRATGRPKQAAPPLGHSEIRELAAMIQGGQPAKAETRAGKLLKKHPETHILLDVMAGAQLAQSKFREASRTLEKLISVRPDHVDAHYNLGLAYVNLGDTEKAAVKFQEVADRRDNSADVFTNLGAALSDLERFLEAIEAYRKALEIDPNFVPALKNLGAALRDIREFEQSELHLRRVPELAPGYAAGHASLGVTQKMSGKRDDALQSFQAAISIDPKNSVAHYEIANLEYEAGDYDAAISHYQHVESKTARVRILEALHQAGHRDELLPALAEFNRDEPGNLRGAAFSAFASQQYGIENTHPFAPDPMDFISVRRIDDELREDPAFLDKLMSEAERIKAVWENHTTRGGFQTYGNLFRQGTVFERVARIVRREIEAFRKERRDTQAGIIRDFPRNYDLDGWHVKLMRAGFQKPHIHARGWFSGVLYLKVPENMKGDEGAISFGLHGYDYLKLRDDVPERLHRPKPGDLVLFPSSLFHQTVPFESEEDRQCIAFDMVPARAKNGR